MKQYRYGMRLRPFSIGCQPMDGFVRCEESKRYHNELIYSRELTDKELREYELDSLEERKEK